MVRERLHKIKKKDRRRPLTVRAIAVVMALAMVLSVIYVNNRGSKVEAAVPSVENVTDETYLTGINIKKDFTVNVPAKGVKFKLPTLPADGTGESVTTNIYKATPVTNLSDPVIYYYNDTEGYDPTADTAYEDYDVVSGQVTSTYDATYTWKEGHDSGFVTSGLDATATVQRKAANLVLKWSFGGTEETITDTDVAGIVDLPADVKADLLPTADYSDLSVITIATYEASTAPTITINNETKEVTATDSDKDSSSDTETNKYYCDIEYALVQDDLAPQTFASLAAAVDSLDKQYGTGKDGFYTLQKTVKLKDSSATKVGNTIEVNNGGNLKRNFHVIDEYWVEYNGGQTVNEGTSYVNTALDSYSLNIPASGKVNPSKDVVIYFMPDQTPDMTKTKVTLSGTGQNITTIDETHSPIYSITIPGDVTANLGKTPTYTVEIQDGDDAEVKESFSVTLNYGNGTPTVSIDSSAAYSTQQSFTVAGTASAPSTEEATISGDDVKFYQGTTNDIASATENACTSYSGASATYDATLTPGINYFWLKATSSYGTSATSSPVYTIFYDDADPVITTATINQGSDINTTISGNSITASNKITMQKTTDLSFKLSDKQTDGSSDGSGISSVTVDGAAATISGDTATYTLAADTSNVDGTTKTATVVVTDAAGNSNTYTLTLDVYKESATVTDVFSKDETEDGSKFFKWNNTETASAQVTYRVESEVEITKAELSVDSGTYYDASSITDNGNGTFDIVGYTYPSTTHADYDIKLKITNANGYVNPVHTTAVRSVDLTSPTIDNITAEEGSLTGWCQNLVINVFVSDGTISSGIDHIEATGTTDTSVAYTGSPVQLTVKGSENSSGTAVSIKAVDKAGNVSVERNETYKVDKKAPELSLSIAGKKHSEVDGKVIPVTDPLIEYSMDDKSMSGLDPNECFLKIDGIVWGSTATDVSGQTLSHILGTTLDPKKDYKVELVAKDNVGNESTALVTTFRVDSKKPDVTGSIDTVAKKASRPTYFNQDVSVSVTVTDDNIFKDNITAVDSNGHAIEYKFDPSATGCAGTISASSEGDYEITVTATDEGGLVGTWTVSFTIDKTDPAVVTLLNGSEYTASNSYYSSAVTTGIEVTDDTEDINDITATIYRDIPGDGSETQVKSGKGPFTISEDGRYTVTYKVVDKAGNETTKTIGFTVDKTFPVNNLYVTTDNPAKYDSYQNNYINQVGKFTRHKNQENYAYGQYYSSDVTIELGYFEYNLDWVYVTDNGVEIKPTWSETKGYGTATITISEEGYHEIKMWTCDLAGNDANDNSVGKTIRFTIDKTQPYLSIFVNGSQYTEGSGVRYLNTNANVTVSSNDTNNDSSDIKRYYKMTPPGGSSATTEAIIGDGTENFATEADYELQYTVTDKAGNISATRNVFFRVDKTAPQVSISDVGATSTASSVSLSFTVKEAFYWDMNPVKITIYKKKDGQGETLEKTIEFTPRSANDSTSYTFTDDAEYRMEMVAEDKCGNKTETKYAFIKDGTAPTIMLSGVSNYDKTDKDVSLKVSVNEAFYSTNKVSLSGTRTDINGKKNNIEFDNFVTNRSQLSELEQLFNEDGIYDITVTSTDKAGNTTTKSVHFTIDTTDPEIGDLSKYDGIKTNKFEWDVNLDELVKDLTVCEINLYLDGALYDGTSEIADGSHVLRVEATDELGHKSFKEVTFVLDSKGPNIIVSNVEEGDRLLEATEVTVTVELDEDILDAVQLNGKTIEVNDNKAVLTIDQKGSYKLAAAAHDEAGNNTTAEVNFTFGKQTNLLIIGIIAGVAILLLILLLLLLRRRRDAR